jgi:D-alanyl-D-alanine carboxypeptidase/D-alanyl-D-alanine-endopeptidase (penicillin-binding protein 4)
MFLKYLGAKVGGGGSAKTGAKVVGDFLRRLGVPEEEFAIADGSGLSRENLVTPAAFCALLKGMAKSPHIDVFKASLPTPGEKGTLAGRMKTAPTNGRVWAKTGSIGGVRSLSGYIQSRDKELFAFSFIVNNDQSEGTRANRLQDEACRLIAGFSRAESQK